MKKMVGSLLMTSALLLGSVAPVVANAATVDSAQTTTTANFEEGDQITAPVDPTDPNKPGTPDGGNGTDPSKDKGKLALIYVPETLSFGTNKVNVVSDDSLPAVAEGTSLFTKGTDEAVLQVSDVRGTNAGWSLGVTSSALTQANGTDTLKGATIDWAAGTVKASGASLDNGAVAANATGITTDGQGSKVILSATDGNGAGVTSDSTPISGIKLNVLANTAKVGTYTGTLNWTLTDSVQ